MAGFLNTIVDYALHYPKRYALRVLLIVLTPLLLIQSWFVTNK